MDTLKTGWLLNKSGEKFAPKTLLSQVSTDDGILLEEKLENDLINLESQINNNINISVENEKSERQVEISVERARIDNLIALEESSEVTDIERELTDIRVKIDGTISDTAGNAIREQINQLSSEILDVNKKANEEIEKVATKLYENEFDITNSNNHYMYGFNNNGGMVASSGNNPIPFVSHKIKVIANKTYYIIKNNLNIGIDKVFLYDDGSALESTSTGTRLELTTLREMVKFTPNKNGWVVVNAYLANATSVIDYKLFVGCVADGNYHIFGDIGFESDVVKATLVNPSYIIENYTLDSNGALNASSNRHTSGYIRIKRGKTYGTRKYNYNTDYTVKYCLYDDNFNFVSTASPTGQFSFIAEFDGYIRLVVMGGGNLVNCSFRCISDMKQDGNVYEYGEERIKDSLLPFDFQYGYANGVFTSFGDSLVGNNNWQSYVAKEFGMYHKNCGVGGSLVHGTTENAMWQDSRINAIPTDTRLLIIHAGTNDDKDYTVIGELSEIGATHDTNTFIGAYQTMLEKMYNRCPNARTFILLPLYNSGESRLEEIREAIRSVASLYGYPFYESKKLMGFNKLNQSIYYADEGGFVHTNELGGKRMADCIIGFVKNYQMTNELS